MNENVTNCEDSSLSLGLSTGWSDLQWVSFRDHVITVLLAASAHSCTVPVRLGFHLQGVKLVGRNMACKTG